MEEKQTMDINQYTINKLLDEIKALTKTKCELEFTMIKLNQDLEQLTKESENSDKED